jgi:endoglucanase
VRAWAEEHSHPPYTFRSGNTTGGALEDEELRAAVELLISTKDAQYARRIEALWPYMAQRFDFTAVHAVRAMPYMSADFRARVEAAVRSYKTALDSTVTRSPFGVPITTGGWGGSAAVLSFAMRNYILHRAFPEIIGPEYTLRGLAYVLGAHPSNSVSMVSGVGAHSKTFAYGANRADFSFIPGGIVPGIVIVQPDLPELMEDWPFLWYESEYVVPQAGLYLFVANAARELMK